jgi:hypothetical protein
MSFTSVGLPTGALSKITLMIVLNAWTFKSMINGLIFMGSTNLRVTSINYPKESFTTPAVTSWRPTEMKTIYSMGRGKYITLDSYGESRETRRGSIAVAIFSIIIAAISASALLGVDITSPSTPTTTNGIHGSTGR